MKIMIANFTKMVEDSGGMAKVTCIMANELVKRGHDVSLVYSDVKEGKFFYPIDKKVRLYDLRHYDGQVIGFPLHLVIKREIYRILKDHLNTQGVTFKYMTKYLSENLKKIFIKEQPDIIISHNLGTSNVFFEKLDISIPLITMSHGDPIYYFTDTPQYVLESFRKSIACQVLLPSHKQHIIEHMSDTNVVVISNAVQKFDCEADLARDKDEYRIIFIGGLIKNIKRPHLLVEAFAKIADEFPNWIVELWGPEDRKSYMIELTTRIKAANLSKRVFVKGATKNIQDVLINGDIFVSPSRAEGFGLTVAEAMSMGIPAVAYKNCSGVNELIADGKNGFLCEDGVDDLASKLKLLMSNRELRVKLGKQAKLDMQKYHPDVIWDAWDDLVNKCGHGVL